MKRIIVHSGVFHADDCMCVAIAKTINPDVIVERKTLQQITEDDKNDPETIIADIGYGEFDHHQPDAKLREDGNKYAACGLMFEKFKLELFPDEASAELFRNRYIIPIEDADNGISSNPLSYVIIDFRPDALNTSGVDMMYKFNEAVDFIQKILERAIDQAKAATKAKKKIKFLEESAINGLLVTEEYFPTPLLIDSSITLEVSPSLRGGYQLCTVKVAEGSFIDKLILPEEWLTNKPEGCTFVHQNRFIASFDDKESAVKAAMTLVS